MPVGKQQKAISQISIPNIFFILLVTCLNSQKISKTITRPAFSTVSKAFVGPIRITVIWGMRGHIINLEAKSLNPCNRVTALI